MLGEDKMNFNLFSIDMDSFFRRARLIFFNIYTFERMYARLEIKKKSKLGGPIGTQ